MGPIKQPKIEGSDDTSQCVLIVQGSVIEANLDKKGPTKSKRGCRGFCVKKSDPDSALRVSKT